MPYSYTRLFDISTQLMRILFTLALLILGSTYILAQENADQRQVHVLNWRDDFNVLRKIHANIDRKTARKLRKKSIQGKVWIEFITNEDSTISEVLLLKMLHPLADAEAIRLVRTYISKWPPYFENGKAEKQRIRIHIDFRWQ
jgi:hypothetical protein